MIKYKLCQNQGKLKNQKAIEATLLKITNVFKITLLS